LFVLSSLHKLAVYIYIYVNLLNKKIISLQKKKMARKQLGLRLEPELIERLKKEASRRNRSVTNLIETWVKEKLDML